MTTTHVALLRGINVGGKNRITMADLSGAFAAAGCRDVRTYIQSGNVLFAASDATAERVAGDVAARLEKKFALRTPVVLRTPDALLAARDGSPFHARGDTPDWLHVVFLAGAPQPAHVTALDPHRSPGDTFAVVGSDIHLSCPNGLGRTKLTNAYFDRALATVSTVRNWRTVTTLIEMSRGA